MNIRDNLHTPEWYLPGITIGDNTVGGAKSVANKDLPANVMAAGNPCRALRPIGEKDRQTYCKGRRIDPAILAGIEEESHG